MQNIQVVARDEERFKLLFTNSRPEIPAGHRAPLRMQSVGELIDEQAQKVKSSAVQPT